MTDKNYELLFEEKIKELEETLPKMEKDRNCAEITLDEKYSSL